MQFVRSDACGAWTLAADGSSHCQRAVARRYWHHEGHEKLPVTGVR
ncbi:MAG: hypothetical protein H7Z19_09700 [Chitinophagaceae bacterium]|nr:hypothetical protein [Rubrivivax sp.]